MTSFNLNYPLRMLSPNIVTVRVTASTYVFGGGHKSLHWTTEPQGSTGLASVCEHSQFCHIRGRETPKKSESRVVHRQKYAKSVILHVLIDLWVNFPLQKKKLEKKLKINFFRAEENTQRQAAGYRRKTRCGFAATAVAKSLQSCPTLCDPIDGSPPDFPAPGIL